MREQQGEGLFDAASQQGRAITCEIGTVHSAFKLSGHEDAEACGAKGIREDRTCENKCGRVHAGTSKVATCCASAGVYVGCRAYRDIIEVVNVGCQHVNR